MTRLLSAMFFTLLTGAPIFAQTVIVRSGEHEKFSRLVLQLPHKAGWSIKQSERSISLNIDMPLVRYDVSHVFDRIPHNRLSALSQSGPGGDLIFSLGCACSVSSFVEPPGFLVIDIMDNNPTSKPRQKTIKQPINRTPYRFPALGESVKKASLASRELMLPIEIGRAPKPKVKTNPPNFSKNRANRPNNTINLSEERLLAQINRASDQGLLELRTPPEVANIDIATSGKPVTPKTTGYPMEGPMPLPVSLSATTAIDRDMALITQSIEHSTTKKACLGSDQVALHDWGGQQPFSVEIGHWRSQVFGEFDKVNPAATVNLARAYLYFGFGAEAAQIVDLSLQSDAESRILKAISRILDTDMATEYNPFAGQQNCDGDVALWAILSTGGMPEDVNKNAVQRAFSRLPPHLRNYLGPRVSQKFSRSGDRKMASSILRAIARSGVEPGSGVELAKAAVAELKGDVENVELELSKSLAAGSEHSPEALVRLVENKFETRGEISPDLPNLAAAYALEFRSAAIGVELRRAHAVSLALIGQFPDAFGTLTDLEARDGPQNKQVALNSLLALLTERAGDVVFLQFALTFPMQNPDAAPIQINNKIARRLINLGFPEQAAQLVDTPEQGHISMEQRLMRAEIALARRLPNRAMVELLGVTGPKAARLRITAMWQAGNYQRAGQMAVAAEDFDRAARGFWLSEEWESVPEQADAHYAHVVSESVQLRATDPNIEQLTPLAKARALMRQSATARAGIADLLQTVIVEPETSGHVGG